MIPSDCTVTTLQSLNDLSIDVTEISANVKDFRAELGQTSGLIRKLDLVQEGKPSLL